MPNDDDIDRLLARGGLGGPRRERIFDEVHRAVGQRKAFPWSRYAALGAPLFALSVLHHPTLARFRTADWQGAADGFSQLARREPGSLLYRLFLERIEALRRDPPGPDWDGTFTHWEK